MGVHEEHVAFRRLDALLGERRVGHHAECHDGAREFSLQSRVPIRLLSAGEAFDDLVFVGLDRLPRAGEEVRTDRFSATIGGGAVITAVAAARLRVPVALISGLSERAERRLRAERIAVTNLRKPGEPHAITAALSIGRERAFVTFEGMNGKLERRLAPALKTARASHVHLALYPRDTAGWRRRLNALRRRGVTSSWDFGWIDQLARDPHLTALIDSLDVVFVNEREAALYSGAPDLETSLPFWRDRRPLVVIKLGGDGCFAIKGTSEWRVKAPKITPVDTTGAGDAFNGGFLASWLRGAPMPACLRAGNRIGAASTRRAGGIEALPYPSTGAQGSGRRM
jgi:sugar/nucleoside kinase (ribokinase family)